MNVAHLNWENVYNFVFFKACEQDYNVVLVVYGGETRPLTLREERNEGPWKQGAEENILIEYGWKKRSLEVLYEQLHNFYSSPSIIIKITTKRMRLALHVAWFGEKEIIYVVNGEVRNKETSMNIKT
jgi:hypothetical protein